MNRVVVVVSVVLCAVAALNCSPGNPLPDAGNGGGGGAVAGAGGGSALAGGFAGGNSGGGTGGNSGFAGGGSAFCSGTGGGDPSACVCPPSTQDLDWLTTFASCQTAPAGEAMPITFRFHNVNAVPVQVRIGPGFGFVGRGCVTPVRISNCNGVKLEPKGVCPPCSTNALCESCPTGDTVISPGQSSTYVWNGRSSSPFGVGSRQINLPAGRYQAGIVFQWLDGGAVISKGPDGGDLYAETPFTLRPDAGEVSINLAL